MRLNINPKWVIVFIYVFVIIAACVALTSCNPVKQVLKDNDKMIEVWEKGTLAGWCSNDTIIQSKSDTLISFDTLYNIEYVGDTLILNDVKTVIKTEYKTIVKKVIIRDTVTNNITDNSISDLLKRDNSLLVANESKLKQDLKDIKKQRNKWRFRFWLLVIAAGIYVARKPIWRGLKAIISPVKI